MAFSVRAALCAAAVAATVVTGCRTTAPDSGSADGSGQGKAPQGSALKAVDDLTVKGRSPRTGYSRERFGRSWVDIDHNDCGTRDDILRRDLTQDAVTGGCKVTAGVLDDPYTGRRIHFTRGHSDVDIDHVVALSDAWQKGASQWSRDKRESLANDPLNLLAVDASTNRSKGDGDTATWLPPNKGFRCAYVARQVAVKKKYELRVTRAEKDAMVKVLKGCPDEKLPSAGRPAPPGQDNGGDTGTGRDNGGGKGDGGKGTGGGGKGGGSVTYRNCDAVRAAGKAPLHRGDPGYSGRLDRDGDGVACDK
ncbi:GmrSD restriction endonuclease domain-containing protein [Wenjunlia tyrosinilytica]|uniref:Calcium-binding protein n=1 Tax=Wenjunlia tyrosinilytica TaxID=1544741 RepID=A0A917ZQC7_9ACTN|nr:calcium-binding protein [Wenjunlia tyrosinilytica]